MLVGTPSSVADDGSVTVQALESLWLNNQLRILRMSIGRMEQSVEHLVSMFKGGVHSLTNVIIVCRLCNATKHKRHMMRSSTQKECLIYARVLPGLFLCGGQTRRYFPRCGKNVWW